MFQTSSNTGQVHYTTTASIAGSNTDYYPFGEVMPGRNSNPTDHQFGYQGQEQVGYGSRWYNFNLRMYNPSLGRFNTIDPYSQFHSPYLAMADNPISFVDPSGGIAELTPWQREKLNQGLLQRRNLGEYDDDPLSYFRYWMSINGVNKYREFSFEEFYAIGQEYGLSAQQVYLSLKTEFLQTHDAVAVGPTAGGVSMTGGGSGIFVDGLEVSNTAYNNFVDNTLQGNILAAQSNQVSFGSDANGNWDVNFNPVLNQFGVNETNFERNMREAEEAREYNKAKRELRKILKQKGEIRSPLFASSTQNNYNIMRGVAYVIKQDGLGQFIRYVDDNNYGTEFFFNSIESIETNYSRFLPDYYSFPLKTAAWGHEYFGNHDDLRHIIGSFLTAERYGLSYSINVTSANEFYGFFRHDIPNISSRIRGRSDWAFQLRDFENNIKGQLLWQLWKNNK